MSDGHENHQRSGEDRRAHARITALDGKFEKLDGEFKNHIDGHQKADEILKTIADSLIELVEFVQIIKNTRRFAVWSMPLWLFLGGVGTILSAIYLFFKR